MANQKQDDQLEHSYSSYMIIRDVSLKTCRRRWMIGRRGERGSGISMLAARHDDDDLFVRSWKVWRVPIIFTQLDGLKYYYLFLHIVKWFQELLFIICYKHFYVILIVQFNRTLLEKQGRTHKWCILVDPHTWPCKSWTTSTNIHSATMWGYGMLSKRAAWGDEW